MKITKAQIKEMIREQLSLVLELESPLEKEDQIDPKDIPAVIAGQRQELAATRVQAAGFGGALGQVLQATAIETPEQAPQALQAVTQVAQQALEEIPKEAEEKAKESM
jgi:stage V sporulation protein SpoVS